MEFVPELSPATLLKLISFLFWSGAYLWCSVKVPKKAPEFYSRAITLLHATVASVIGLSQCGIGSLTECRFTSQIEARHYILMLWSWGYFAFDLLWCVAYWSESLLIMLHHISALVAITVYMQKDCTGCTFACSLALLEVTNPLLQTRWFLRNEGLGNTKIFFIVEVVYLIMFLTLRGILGTYVVYRMLTSRIFGLDEKIISVILYLVSLGLISEIMGYVLYKYKTKIEIFTGFLNEIGIILDDHI